MSRTRPAWVTTSWAPLVTACGNTGPAAIGRDPHESGPRGAGKRGCRWRTHPSAPQPGPDAQGPLHRGPTKPRSLPAALAPAPGRRLHALRARRSANETEFRGRRCELGGTESSEARDELFRGRRCLLRGRLVQAGRGVARGRGARGVQAAFLQVGGAGQRELLPVLPCPSALGSGRGPAP